VDPTNSKVGHLGRGDKIRVVILIVSLIAFQVVLPVVARKKGLDGQYEQADGSPRPKPPGPVAPVSAFPIIVSDQLLMFASGAWHFWLRLLQVSCASGTGDTNG
jgi:hypothetical protein